MTWAWHGEYPGPIDSPIPPVFPCSAVSSPLGEVGDTLVTLVP